MAGKSLRQLRDEAKLCRDCPLWANATQTVFGAGAPYARAMLVGEQPGDEEDEREIAFRQLVKDLSLIRQALG